MGPVMLFRNFYRCATCGCEWTDVWPAQCDDDCPLCGARAAPLCRLSLSQMSSGWRETTNWVILSPDVGRLQIAVVAAHRIVPITGVP